MMRTTDIIDPQTATTIAGLFCERVRRTPHSTAYRRFNAEEQRFEAITWEKVHSMAASWQAALKRESFLPGDRVAVALRNCPEWVLLDLAVLGLGMVIVPIFADDRPENAAYILRESGSRLVLVEDEDQWKRIEQAAGHLPGIERIVTLRPKSHPKSYSGEFNGSGEAVARTGANSRREPRLSELTSWLPGEGTEYLVNCRESKELATIVYTSGTTGMPKGVMLSHANILEDAFACLQRESIYPDDLFLSFLPLSHTFERTVGYYIPMMAGACVAYARSIDKLPQDLLELRPTMLVSVPRIYERIHKKITAELEEKPALARRLFNLTVSAGWRRFLHLQGRSAWSPALLLWPHLKRIVARRVTDGFGGRLRMLISGGAPLAFPIAQIFIGLGLNLLQGYGLTEASPVVSVNTTHDNVPATVGRPLPGIESTIAANGELLVRGPNVMLGYWHNRKATEEVIDSDGYLHTGDLARMDEGGHLAIIGRLKEIIVLSTGEKVSPTDLELAIAVNPLFEQVMIVGDGRPFLAALVVLNRPRWEKMAAGRGVHLNPPDLVDGNRAEKILLSEIDRCITGFPGYARIRRVHATLSPWRMQDGLISNTLKLKRKELLAKFELEVESLFKGH
jgi:long-chain acyl-CoA synthetase